MGLYIFESLPRINPDLMPAIVGSTPSADKVLDEWRSWVRTKLGKTKKARLYVRTQSRNKLRCLQVSVPRHR